MKSKNLFSRLRDPRQCVTDQEFTRLSKKISKAMIGMAAYTENGGNPFLFSLIGTKPHELAFALPKMKQCEFTSCASDGKKFYWHPDFLGKLDNVQLKVCMAHEAWHIALDHIGRSAGKEPAVWNIAIDYIVNSIIEDDWRKVSDEQQSRHTPWGGILGNPMSLQQFLNFLQGGELLPTRQVIFADPLMLHKTPEWIYQQILELWHKSPRSKQFGPDSKNSALDSLDTHIESDLGKDDLDEELTNASKHAENLEPGSTPQFIEDYLKNLYSPSLDLLDMVRSSCFFKRNNDGMKNNWKRPRRRGLALGQYMPRRYTHDVKWLCLIDSSGSMTVEHISRGLSQLQSLGDGSIGHVVCCDAKVHWKSLIEIDDISDLKDIKIVGRGGTTLDHFFKELPKKLGFEYDTIIVITDGKFVPPAIWLEPLCPVIWVIVTKHKFIPNFGKVVYI